MKNKGFLRFETITIILIIILLFAGGMYLLIQMTDKAKPNTMNKSSLTFIRALDISENAFSTYRSYYLVQAIDEGVIKDIKSPFSKGNCDVYESKVRFESNFKFVTLKCGDYLIKDRKSNETSYTIYKVGPWIDTRTNKNDDSRVVYGCDDCGLDTYYEEPVFVYMFNKVNGTSYSYLDDLKTHHEVTSKEQFRTMEKFYEG